MTEQLTEKIKGIKKELKRNLDKNRMEHTIGVMYTCASLAMIYDLSLEQAMLSGLLHDCAKSLKGAEQLQLCEEENICIRQVEKENPYLLHAKTGACIARKRYGIVDEEILAAISVHTTGQAGMSLLSKIVFVADYIEPNRKNDVKLAKIRKLAFENLNQAVLLILEDTISNLKNRESAIDQITIEAYEYYKRIVQEEI